MKRELSRRRATQAAEFCTRCNDFLLVVAMLLALVVTAGQQQPREFAAVVAHLDWLAPPMDLQTGILLEHAISGAAVRPAGLPSDEKARDGAAPRVAASD